MVQLSSEETLAGIATQGKESADNAHVMTYILSYSIDGTNFTNYTENGAVRVSDQKGQNSF